MNRRGSRVGCVCAKADLLGSGYDSPSPRIHTNQCVQVQFENAEGVLSQVQSEPAPISGWCPILSSAKLCVLGVLRLRFFTPGSPQSRRGTQRLHREASD